MTDTQGKKLLVTLFVMQQVSGHRMVAQRQLQAKLSQEQALQHGRVQVSQLLLSANHFKMEIKWQFSQRTCLLFISITMINSSLPLLIVEKH